MPAKLAPDRQRGLIVASGDLGTNERDARLLGQLLARERLATAWALTKAERPNLTITVPTIDAAIVGEFYYLMQLQTVMAGALYRVNPFGQPGVEAGKNATYALMGRSGYEKLKEELLSTPENPDAYLNRP